MVPAPPETCAQRCVDRTKSFPAQLYCTRTSIFCQSKNRVNRKEVAVCRNVVHTASRRKSQPTLTWGG
nr:MAG TPA: hypothetical protein [Caudoviricetes sp.]